MIVSDNCGCGASKRAKERERERCVYGEGESVRERGGGRVGGRESRRESRRAKEMEGEGWTRNTL